MRLSTPLSEQLFNCSDNYARFHRRPAPQTPGPDPAPASLGAPRGARLAHRTLPALRQAWMSLRLRPRPRSQILFVGQLPQRPAATAVPLSGTAHPGASPDKKLSARARSVGTNMRHQPPTVAPPGKGLNHGTCGGLADRSSAVGSNRGHYAPGFPPGWCAGLLACFGAGCP